MGSSRRFRRLVYRHATASLKIEVTDKYGDIQIGTGFHIGEGYIVSARHVIDNPAVKVKAHCFIGSKTRDGSEGFGDRPDLRDYHDLEIEKIYYPDDAKIDLAVVKTDFNSEFYMGDSVVDADPQRRDQFMLGNFFDEEFWDKRVLLKQVVMVGFPRIPHSNDAFFVAVRADINAVIEKYSAPCTHLILSSMARGGFSGGPVLNKNGKVIAVCTESLNRDTLITEAGFTAAVTIEQLNRLLVKNNIFPGLNSENVKGFASEIGSTDSWRKKRHPNNSVITG